MLLRPYHLFNGISRQIVEKKGQKQGKQENEGHLDNEPLKIVPNNVADGFERVQEPHEGRVRAPAKRKR